MDSDTYFDPQALILDPKNVFSISKEIVEGKNYIDATVKGCVKGIEIIENALEEGELKPNESENIWFEILKNDLFMIPIEEDKFIEEMLPCIDPNKIILSEYGI